MFEEVGTWPGILQALMIVVMVGGGGAGGWWMRIQRERELRIEERAKLRAIYNMNSLARPHDGQKAAAPTPGRRARISDADMSPSRPPETL